MTEAIHRLNQGDWVHIFPEGKCYQESASATLGRSPLKWGVGHLIMNSRPLLLPLVHSGLEAVKPLHQNRIGLGVDVRVTVGQVVDTDDWLQQTSDITDEAKRRSRITEMVEEELKSLLHQQNVAMGR